MHRFVVCVGIELIYLIVVSADKMETDDDSHDNLNSKYQSADDVYPCLCQGKPCESFRLVVVEVDIDKQVGFLCGHQRIGDAAGDGSDGCRQQQEIMVGSVSPCQS